MVQLGLALNPLREAALPVAALLQVHPGGVWVKVAGQEGNSLMRARLGLHEDSLG